MQNTNTVVSYAFRALVVVHLFCLYVLIFGMRTTLFGFEHFFVAVALTVLMTAIVALLVVDMMTRKEPARKLSKVIDGALGSGWLALMAFLFLQNLRSGIW